MNNSKIVQVQQRVPLSRGIPLSIQHTFAMFSASVLVPYLLGISPAIALLMNGVGTLIFIFVTKGKSPAYLGSSFAFISPALLVINNPNLGYQYALGGFVVTGFIFMTVAVIVKFAGVKWIDTVLPPAAMGQMTFVFAAFIAVLREGAELILFYKASFSGGMNSTGWRWPGGLAFDGRASEPRGDGMSAPQLRGGSEIGRAHV